MNIMNTGETNGYTNTNSNNRTNSINLTNNKTIQEDKMTQVTNNLNELEAIATYYTGIDYTSRTETEENLRAIIKAYKDDEDMPAPKFSCTGFKNVTFEPRVLEHTKRYELMTNIKPIELRHKYHINGFR